MKRKARLPLSLCLSLLPALLPLRSHPQDPFYPTPAGLDTARLLLPGNLAYQGAFRPPAGNGTSQYGFTYLVGAMAHHAGGDAAGPADGFPGSLFLAGHSSERLVAEISIPPPRLHRTWDSLPRAALLSPFRRLASDPGSASGIWTMDFELTGPEGRPGSEVFHTTLGDGYLPPAGVPTYSTQPYSFAGETAKRLFTPDNQHCYDEYLFSVPESWSSVWAPGMRLAGGRHREGDLCGEGPALYLMAPWTAPASSTVATSTLLRYKQTGGSLRSYSRGGDVFYAGQWLEAGAKSAVVFSGRKGLGQPEYGTYCGVQGFHDLAGYKPYVIFYDPVDLGRVLSGQIESHVPQPYAALDLSDLLIFPNTDACRRHHLNDFAFDAANGLLYATERSRGEYPAVHVWKVQGGAIVPPPPPPPPPPDTSAPPDTTTPPDTTRPHKKPHPRGKW